MRAGTDDSVEVLVLLALFGWAGVVAAAVCGCRALWEFLWRGTRAVWRGLGPWQAGRTDPRLAGVGGGEPAHPAYWWRQSWADALSAGRAGLRALWSAFTGRWLHRIVKNLFLGRRPSGRPGSMPLTRFLLAVLVAPGTAAGALAGAVLATVLLGWGLVAGWSAAGRWCVASVSGARIPAATRPSRWPCTAVPAAGCTTPHCGRGVTACWGTCAGAGTGCRPPGSRAAGS